MLTKVFFNRCIIVLFFVLGGHGCSAQSIIIDDHKLIKYEGEWFELTASIDIPAQEKALQDTCSSIIFNEIFGAVYEDLKAQSFQELYSFFLYEVKEYPLDKIKNAKGKQINLQIKKGYGVKSKYGCYSVSYNGYIGLMDVSVQKCDMVI